MSKLDKYNGNIELISGITQKNGQDFALIEAHAVQMDNSGTRLDDAFKNISIDDEKIVSAVTKSQVWKDTIDTISDNEQRGLTNETNIRELQDKVNALTEGEDTNYGVAYVPEKSTLFLFKGSELIEGENGNVISSTIIAGGGGGSTNAVITSIDRITAASQTILYGRTGIIEFTLKSKNAQGEDNDSPHIIKIYVNDNLVETKTNAYPGNYSIDVTEYLLSNTENSIRITATDMDSGSTASKRWTISTVEIILTSTFAPTNAYSGNASLRYTITGNVTKTIHVLLNGEAYGQPINISGSTSGTITIEHQPHGVYTLELYCTAEIGEETVQTDSLLYEVLFRDSDNSAPLIRTNYIGENQTQYNTFTFEYSIYNPDDIDAADVSFYVSWDGVTYDLLSTLTIASNTLYNAPVYDLSSHGTLYYKIVCGSTERILVVNVENFGVEILPITDGLAFDFNPVGRSNNSSDKDTYTYNSYSMTVNDGFDWVNGGWILDDNGDSCFLIKAGDSIDIDYKALFGALGDAENEDPKYSGREFKIIYKVDNVYSIEKSFLSCYDDENGVGIRMYPHITYINSSASQLEVPLSESDIIEFEYNLSASSSDITMVMPYEDGTPSKPMIYKSSDSFNQRNEKTIHIGSEDCDVYLYRLKIYNNSLEDKEILTNFIADGRTGAEKASRYIRNQIYDVNGKLTPESVAEACPDLRVVVVSAPIFTADKKDKIKDTTVKMIYKNGDAILDNWTAYNCTHNGQGTSSNEYGYAGRNIDVSMRNKATSITTYTINTNSAYKDENGLIAYNFGEKVTEDDAIYIERYPVQDLSTIGTAESHLETTQVVYNSSGSTIEIGSTIASNAIIYDSADTETRVLLDVADVTTTVTTYTSTVITYDEAGLPKPIGTVFKDGDECYATNDLEHLQLVTDINMVTDSITKTTPASVFILGDGSEAKKVSLTRDSVENDYFNIKVNIASSENANNALLQKRYNRYIPYTSYATQKDSKVKNSMEFFNCVVFIQETNEDITTHREFNDTDIHFYAIGNFGDSKKTDKTRVANNKDDKEFTLEITDWNNYLSMFPMDTMIECPTSENEEENFKKKENLGLMYELVDGEYVLTSDTDIVDGKTYYIDALENEPYDDSWTYDIRYSTKTDESLKNVKTIWHDFYRFVTRDLTTNGVEDKEKVEAWKEEFKDWFVLDSALYWYLFTLRYTMVDNRAKNTFWHYGLCPDGKYRFDLWDYDNDTALGIDNAGKLTMTYGVEDTDRDSGNVLYFRGAESTFFCRVRDYFSKELMSMYKNVNTACFSSTSLINEYDAWQSQFPEELWRLDYERKYKRTYLGGYGLEWDNAVSPAQVGKGANPSFLIDMMNGRKKYQRRQFERDQDFYMASKFMSTTNYNDSVMLRCTNPSGAVPAPDYTIHITPYMNMYVNLYNNTDNYYFHQRCKAGETYTIPYPADVADFIYIRGASKIQSFGDLSLLYLQQALLGSAEKLKELVIGNHASTYSNPSLEALEFSANPLLEKIDITNTAFSSPLDLSMLQHLKELYTEGSNVTGVSFANNGLLEIAKLNDVTSLQMKNLLFIKEFTLTNYDKLTSLNYENCKIDKDIVDESFGTTKVYDLGLNLVNNASNLNRIRMIDVNWDYNYTYNWNSSVSVLERIAEMNGFTSIGSNQTKSVLTGKALVSYLTQSRLTKFNTLWPNLEVGLSEGGSFKEEVNITFVNEDGTELYKTVCDVDGKITDPVESGIIPTPTKESTAQYDYEFAGWNWSFDDPVKDNLTISALYNEILRSYRVRWFAQQGDETPLATAIVPYGTGKSYEEAIEGTDAPKIPSRVSEDSTYYIFNGWDNNAFYVTGPKDINAVWQSGTYNKNKNFSEMTPAEIKAMVAGNYTTTKLGSADTQTGETKIDIQLGYMPSFSDITEHIIVAEETKFIKNTTTPMSTDQYLLNEDKSWTLAADIEFKYKEDASSSTPSILVGCYDSTKKKTGAGFIIATTGNGKPTVYWGNDSTSFEFGTAPTVTEAYNASNQVVLKTYNSMREMVVIRHVAGDNNLYVYYNDRYSNDAVVEKVLTRTSPHGTIISPLTLGAEGYIENGEVGFMPDTEGVGSIHYLKLWDADLGSTECKKIANWIYAKQTFQYYGPQLYYIGETGRAFVHASFIAENLLDGLHILSDSSSSQGGFSQSSLFKWLNEKFYNAFPPAWKQLLVQSRVPMSTGYDPTLEDEGKDIYNTELEDVPCYIFIPSWKDVDSSATTAGSNNGLPWSKEGAMFKGSQTTIKWFADDSSRIKYLGNGDKKYNQIGDGLPNSGNYDKINHNGEKIPYTYYLASPNSESSGNIWYKVWADGQVSTYDTTNWTNSGGNVLFGVCPCFSI